MDAAAAESIVREAKALGVYERRLPTTEGGFLREANKLVEQALDAFSGGVRGDHVTRILKMADVLPGAPLESSNGEKGDIIGQPDEDTQESSGAQGAGHPEPTPHRQAAEEMVRSQGLPVPSEMEGDPPEMPRDMTAVGDRQLRRLHSEFNGYLVRTSYLLGLERADKAAADKLHERALRTALRKTGKTYVDGKPKPQHVLLAEAAADPDVVKWEERAAQHDANLSVLYTMRDIYQGNIDRIRQEWRMRVDEWTMSGGGSR